ncbi:MAG: hypothetical protein M1383_03755 [Patescibacteria group bacterium]|nr:hypothetical protein [Patescibacteria group bacterium]
MKRTLFIASAVILLAAGCNKAANNNQPQNNQGNQNQQPQNQQSSPSPDQMANWNTYASPDKYGFEIKYPNDFGFNTNYDQIKNLGYIPVCDQTTKACVLYTGDAYKGTNFEDAGVSINIDPSLNTEAKCYNFNAANNEAQTPVADAAINGVDFKSATGGQGAAGHFMKTQEYRNLHNGMCYEIAQRLGQTNIGNYPEGTVKPFDENQVWGSLQQIVNTFKFIPIDTASWKTYQSRELSIEFKYNPDDYSVPEYSQKDQAVYIPSKVQIPGTANGYVTITKINNKPSSYIDEQAKDIGKQSSFEEGGCSITSRQSIAGQKALRFQCAGMGDTNSVLIEYPGRQAVLSIDSDFTEDSFDGLIRSIKFIKLEGLTE